MNNLLSSIPKNKCERLDPTKYNPKENPDYSRDPIPVAVAVRADDTDKKEDPQKPAAPSKTKVEPKPTTNPTKNPVNKVEDKPKPTNEEKADAWDMKYIIHL